MNVYKKWSVVLLTVLVSITPLLSNRTYAQAITGLTPAQIINLENENAKKYDRLRKIPDPYSDEGKEWREKSSASGLEKDAIGLLDYEFREDIYEQLLEYEEDHPGGHPRDELDFFINLCKLYNHQNMKEPKKKAALVYSEQFYPVDEGKVGLNGEQASLYNSDPVAGFKSLLAVEEALKTTASLFTKIGHYDKSEAFLQMAMQVYLVHYTNSYSWASRWGGDHLLTRADRGLGEPERQQAAIRFNNALVGRLAASNNDITSKSSSNEIKSILFRVYASGELMKLDESKVDGEFYAKTFRGRYEDYTRLNPTL